MPWEVPYIKQDVLWAITRGLCLSCIKNTCICAKWVRSLVRWTSDTLSIIEPMLSIFKIFCKNHCMPVKEKACFPSLWFLDFLKTIPLFFSLPCCSFTVCSFSLAVPPVSLIHVCFRFLLSINNLPQAETHNSGWWRGTWVATGNESVVIINYTLVRIVGFAAHNY